MTQTSPRSGRTLLVPAVVLLVLWLAGAVRLHADTITGTVKDPSGAAVGGAHRDYRRDAQPGAGADLGWRGKIQRTRFERREVLGTGKQRRI
jgi:hypothetical protein